ncbi:receptor-type tyrosine-protein phosphatase S-like isoform X3 [Vespula maculifrons]|uniref:Receptor-type tyrosine-protein phosphatase S-like isoform X3 n=1 Tax=Vespula maculifrons TaxID=7453 RepID=A0ABD2CA23_VESMC
MLDQMTRCRFLSLLLLAALVVSANAAKGGGPRGAGRNRGGRRMYGSSAIPMSHRNSASVRYYENKDGAKIVKASHFELDYMLGRKITFFCMATGYPRPEITWLKDGIELYHHKFFQVHEWPVGNDTIKSKMEIDPATQKDAGYYECQADNQYAVDRRSFRTDYSTMRYATFLIILLTILLLNSRESFGRRGRARARSKSRVQIGLPITGKYRDTESDQYYNNDNGAKILLASHFDLEYVLGHKIAFLCVARGTPRPHITWFKDGTEIYSHLYLHVHEWQVGPDKVKSKLEIDPATQMDAGIYECTADNMYSIDRRSFKTDFSIAFD